MKFLALSRAAAGLVRALVARGQDDRNRILLMEIVSTDWHSLTFSGERHVLTLRASGPDAQSAASRLTEGIAETEFALGRCIVADISAGPPSFERDGSVSVEIEALTIEE